MRRYGRWICLVLVMMLLGSQAAFAGRGSGSARETATKRDTSILRIIRAEMDMEL